MSSYRDGLEAATHRIDSLEQQLALKQGHVEALQQRLATRAAVAGPRWPWFLAMFGAVLSGALLSSSLPAPRASAAAPADPPEPRWGGDSIFADPAPHLATHGARSAAAEDDEASTDDGPASGEREACDAADQKAALLVKLASGRASDGELGDLHLSCVLSGDVACRRLAMSEIKARRLTRH